jgi:Rieske Fe-S protein
MSEPTFVSRRQFCAVAAGGALASNLIQVGCSNDVTPAPLVEFKRGLFTVSQGVITFPDPMYHELKDFPDLTPIGGALTLAYPQPTQTLIIHLPDVDGKPAYAAMQSACPHAQCPLGFNLHDMLVECPCHGSRFTPYGALVKRPAVSAPPLYGVQVMTDPSTNEAMTLVISTSSCSVNATLNFSDFPDLQVTGGSTVIGMPTLMCPILVIRTSPTEMVAMDATCTHAGCTVAFNAANNDVECPCHGSRFDLMGAVLSPPAPNPLRKLTATIDPGGATFQLSSMM